MPLRFAVLLLICCSPVAVGAGEEFPYEAFVTSDDVYVRSGPGKNYYPTDKLSAGATVEVYRHDPGGWYAIRPPQGSFSWVSGEFIKPLDEPYAEVVGDRVVARVGTALGDTRDVIQVRLDRGEEVEVIEAKRFGNGPAAQTWYKIAAPAGEFRWIHGEFLDRQPPQPPARRNDHSGNLLVQKIERSREASDEGESIEEADHLPREGTRRIAHEEPLDGDLEAAAARDATPRDARRRPPEYTASRSAPDTTDFERSAPRTLDEELKAIDFELSKEVIEDASTWDFNDLRSRANHVLSQAPTALDRGRARLILKKIDRFEAIRQQRADLSPVRPLAEERRSPSTTASLTTTRPPRRSEARRALVDPRFDGTGTLTQVDSGRPNVPNYALTDANGEVRYYVSPAPGINLRHYIGRQVGLSGSVGYTPDLDGQHVTARRVTVLDGRILR